ncbi:MAG TPA: vanadium-dependent haloperoxidase [Flavobacteriaceae bacterium]|nr:vanadium-dependent haloperoxidase [Flavobacteriaceae bacterium]
MKNQIFSLSFNFLIVLLFIFSIQSCKTKKIEANDFKPEIITSWNKKIMNMAIEEDGLLTLKGVRTEAMMFVAIHDALNSIEPLYTIYSFEGKNTNADPIATVAQAAYEVALSQFPNKDEELEIELNTWLKTVKNNDSKTEGINLGKEVASNILKTRFEDNWNGEADYTWHPMAPGVYAEFNEHSGTPEGFIFGAGWAVAKPFMLSSQDQFRSPPPPEINSEAYTKAFNEVKEYGRFQSEVRTKDQAHLAMWWKDFVENSHNRLARELVINEGLNLWEAARVFALLNMTIYDAYVNVFDNKFHYNHWRPYTAIRWAENDENPDTEPDPEWNNLHKHTYAFPSYPSAHGTASTAAMTVLANTLGTGDKYSFTMTTEEVDKAGPFSEKIKMTPPTRSFESFSQAGLEAAMSRVYLGIHFRYDSVEGYKLGAKIGEYANENYLKPLEIVE